FPGPDGVMWFGGQGGVSKIEAGMSNRFTTVVEVAPGRGLVGGILSIYRDRDGTMWFGKHKGVLHGEGDNTEEFAPKTEFGHVLDFYRATDGTLWIASANFCAFRFDATNLEKFTT